MLVQGIRSLQVHGSDEVALGPLLSLVFLVYSCLRPRFPSLVDILRQVPDASEENLAAFDNRVMAMLQNNEKLVDKNKRDLIRKVLRPVIAVSWETVGIEWLRVFSRKSARGTSVQCRCVR